MGTIITHRSVSLSHSLRVSPARPLTSPAALQTICQDLLKKRANDPVMIFWRGFSVCMEGGRDGPNQAILQFESLQNNNDVSLASTAACLFAHKRCRLVDQEAVEMLTFNVDSKQR